MLLAAFGDVHANLPALRAVLSETAAAGIQTILNTGDCVGGGQSPNETIDCMREEKVISVQGLMDRYAAGFRKKRAQLKRQLAGETFDALEWTYVHLRGAHIEFLAGLPKSHAFTLEGIRILLCHGAPSAQADALRAEDPAEYFRRQRERACADLIVSGLTHEPFARWVDDALFVNPGAAGVPTHGSAEPSYALIDTDQSPWQVTFRRVAYTPDD